MQRKTPAKQKAKNSKDDDEPIIYPKLEDEIFKEVDIKACYSDLGCLSLVNANKISLFFSLAHGLSLFQYVLNIHLNRRSVALNHLIFFCSVKMCNCLTPLVCKSVLGLHDST